MIYFPIETIHTIMLYPLYIFNGKSEFLILKINYIYFYNLNHTHNMLYPSYIFNGKSELLRKINNIYFHK